MYVCTHARTHVRMHACTHARMHACTHARVHACTHARMHAYTHARAHACTHARAHACTHARAHACTRARMYSSYARTQAFAQKDTVSTFSGSVMAYHRSVALSVESETCTTACESALASKTGLGVASKWPVSGPPEHYPKCPGNEVAMSAPSTETEIAQCQRMLKNRRMESAMQDCPNCGCGIVGLCHPACNFQPDRCTPETAASA